MFPSWNHWSCNPQPGQFLGSFLLKMLHFSFSLFTFHVFTQSIVKFCHLSWFSSIIIPSGIIYDISSIVASVTRTRWSVQKLVDTVDGMSSHQSKPSKWPKTWDDCENFDNKPISKSEIHLQSSTRIVRGGQYISCSGSSRSRYFTMEEKLGFFLAFRIIELWKKLISFIHVFPTNKLLVIILQ